MRKTRVGLGVMLSLALGTPAAATHGGPHPTAGTQRVYFHCGANRLNNVDTLNGSIPTWDTKPPTASLAGGGCLNVDSLLGGDQGSPHDASFAGTFTGNVRDLTVTLYGAHLSSARTGSAHPFHVRLSVDGHMLLGGATSATAAVLRPSAVSEGSGPFSKYEFSVTDLGKITASGEGSGLLREDGVGATGRRYVLTVTTFYADATNLWAWDATEVPAGITFNPGTLAATKAVGTPPSDEEDPEET